MVLVLPQEPSFAEFSDYDTLLSTCGQIAGRTLIPGAMTALTADINRALRLREMLVTVTLASSSLPTDFLEAELFEVGERKFQPSMGVIGGRFTFTVGNGVLSLGTGEDPVGGVLTYYARQPVLSTGESNDILRNYPDIYLWGLLAHHARLVRDSSGMADWTPPYQSALAEAVSMDAMSRAGTASMFVNSNAVPDC